MIRKCKRTRTTVKKTESRKQDKRRKEMKVEREIHKDRASVLSETEVLV